MFPRSALTFLSLGENRIYASGEYTFTLANAATINASQPGGQVSLYRNGQLLTSGTTISRPVIASGTYSVRSSSGNGYTLKLGTNPISPPTRLEADVWGGNAIRLNWHDNTEGEAQYRVDRWTRLGWRRSVRTAADATAAVIANLVPDKATTYRVSAVTADGISLRSANVVSATTQPMDTTGWYKAKLTKGMTKAFAGWEKEDRPERGPADTLRVLPSSQLNGDDKQSTWIQASSWQHAVDKALSTYSMVGGLFASDAAKVRVTFDGGGKTKDETAPHFWGNGYFRIGTGKDIASMNGVEGFKLAKDNTKYIALEDSYGGIDRDYDDFYWQVTTEFANLQLEVEDTDDNLNKIISDGINNFPTLHLPLVHRGDDKLANGDPLGFKTATFDFLFSFTPQSTAVSPTGFLWKIDNADAVFRVESTSGSGSVAIGQKVRRRAMVANIETSSTLPLIGGYDKNGDGALQNDEVWVKANIQCLDVAIKETAPFTGVDPGYSESKIPAALLLKGRTNVFDINVVPAAAAGAVTLSLGTAPRISATLTGNRVFLARGTLSSGTDPLPIMFTSKGPTGNNHTGKWGRVDIVCREQRTVNVRVSGFQLPGGNPIAMPAQADIQASFDRIFNNQSPVRYQVTSYLAPQVYNYDLNSDGELSGVDALQIFGPNRAIPGGYVAGQLELIFADKTRAAGSLDVYGFEEDPICAVGLNGLQNGAGRDWTLVVAAHELYHVSRNGHAPKGLMADGADHGPPNVVTALDETLMRDDW